jgi:hypothetical protein
MLTGLGKKDQSDHHDHTSGNEGHDHGKEE